MGNADIVTGGTWLNSLDNETTRFLQRESSFKGLPDHQRHIWKKLAVGSIVINIIVISIVGILISNELLFSPGLSFCTRRLSTYSPALDAIEYYKYEYPNDFYQSDEYRGPPTAEREAAWRRLWQMGDIAIKVSQLDAMNKSELASSYYDSKVDGIPANLEVFHQLHCLHMIRAYTYLDSYTSEEDLPLDFQDVDDEYRREHVDHCITTLRLAVTCTSDVTPILLRRDPDNPMSVLPDFRTSHTCRNFETLHAWFIENSYTDWNCIQKRGKGCDIIPT